MKLISSFFKEKIMKIIGNKCPLCKTTFIAQKNQKIAYWTDSWCSYTGGLLCPNCHEAAKKLNGVVPKEEASVPLLPWGSDIIKEASHLNEKDFINAYQKEVDDFRSTLEK